MDILFLMRDIGIFGLAMWFIQLVISKSADRKFESYMTELDHKTREFQNTLDTKVELFKAELNIQSFKRTKVYERQLEMIIELHKRLVILNEKMKDMTSVVKSVVEDLDEEERKRISDAREAYHNFLRFFYDNTIFIPRITEISIHKIKDDYFESFVEYTFAQKLKEAGSKLNITFEKTQQSVTRINEVIEPALELLAEDFRTLLGVNGKPQLRSEKQT
jgi:hypothetical protein